MKKIITLISILSLHFSVSFAQEYTSICQVGTSLNIKLSTDFYIPAGMLESRVTQSRQLWSKSKNGAPRDYSGALSCLIVVDNKKEFDRIIPSNTSLELKKMKCSKNRVHLKIENSAIKKITCSKKVIYMTTAVENLPEVGDAGWMIGRQLIQDCDACKILDSNTYSVTRYHSSQKELFFSTFEEELSDVFTLSRSEPVISQ